MSERLNERRVDAAKLARLGQSLEGEVDLAVMPRLAPLLVNTEGSARTHLQFGIDVQGQPHIGGRVSATLTMICQRCLEPMTIVIETPVALGIVVSQEQAHQLAAEYEPLLIGEEPAAVAALIEEELMLALPIVPLHAPDQCGTVAGRSDDAALADSAGGVTAKRENPFAVLDGMRRKR